MGSFKKIANTLIKLLIVLAFAFLPMIGMLHLPVYFFIIVGLLLFISNSFSAKDFKQTFDLPGLVFVALYLLQIIGYLVYFNNSNNQFALEQKASFLFVPFLMTGIVNLQKDNWILSVKSFIVGNIFSSFYCFIHALRAYQLTHSTSVFFYHTYSGAIDANAIYCSIYLLIAVLYLINYCSKGIVKINTFWLVIILLFLYFNLLLLSSKMLLTIGSILIISQIIAVWRIKHVKIWSIAFLLFVSIIFSLTSNPIEKRFKQICTNDYQIVLKGNDFTNYPFNGLDFRILLWRMGGELLTENKAWFMGFMGPDYHKYFNNKIIAFHLYAGNKQTHDTGYLNYNLHNQYMDNLMQYGLIGLFLLMTLLGFLFYQSVVHQYPMLLLLTILFSISFFTESFLETQAGILIFTLFIYGEWKFIRKF